MSDEIIGKVRGIIPHETVDQVLVQQQQLYLFFSNSRIEILDKTADELHSQTSAGEARMENVLNQFSGAVKKLSTLKAQLTLISSRITDLRSRAGEVNENKP
jgi:hypothetical protein